MKLSDFFGWFQKAYLLVQEEHRNKKAIEELGEEVDRLSKAVQKLTYQVEHIKEVEKLEREKLSQHEEHKREELRLQIDSILARFENRLPRN